jgi:hypothetical protein
MYPKVFCKSLKFGQELGEKLSFFQKLMTSVPCQGDQVIKSSTNLGEVGPGHIDGVMGHEMIPHLHLADLADLADLALASPKLRSPTAGHGIP